MLMMLADPNNECPEVADDEGRVPSCITQRKVALLSADTALEAVNSTKLEVIEASFREVLDMQLPLRWLPVIAGHMLDRTESALGRKTDMLLWDAAAFSADFAALMRRRTDFVVRTPKNSVVKKWLKSHAIISVPNPVQQFIHTNYCEQSPLETSF